MIIRDLHSLYLPVRRKAIEMLAYVNQHIHGYLIEPFETLRMTERQQKIYSEGFSHTKTSKHQLGLALDVYPTNDDGSFIGGEALDNWPHWDQVGEIGKAHDFKWGGDFRIRKDGELMPWPDKVHFEMDFGLDWDTLKFIFHQKGLKALWGFMDAVLENQRNLKELFQGA